MPGMSSAEALDAYKNFQNTRTNAASYYDQAAQSTGANAAQQRANDLRGLIRNTETALKGVDSSVRGRTQGSLVTSAQQQRLAALEREPIAQELTGHQGAYSDEMANYRDLIGQAQSRAGLQYQSDTDKANSMQTLYEKLFGQEQEQQRQREAERAYQLQLKQIDEENRRWKEQMAFNRWKAQADADSARKSAFTPTFQAQPQVNYQNIIDELNKIYKTTSAVRSSNKRGTATPLASKYW